MVNARQGQHASQGVNLSIGIVGCLHLYIYFSIVLIPLLTPLRGLGVFEPAYLKFLFLPFCIFMFSVLLVKSWKCVSISGFHLVLIVGGALAFTVGLFGLYKGASLKSFFSHLFQLYSAVVMFCVGRLFQSQGKKIKFEPLVGVAIISVVLSTLIVVILWQGGYISRYYTAGYTLIFLGVYGLAYRNSYLWKSFLLLLASNKRGPLLAFSLVWFSSLVSSKRLTVKPVLLFFLMLLAAFMTLLSVLEIFEFEKILTSGLITPVTRTIDRLMLLFAAESLSDIWLAVGRARVEEVIIGLESINHISFWVGHGAGWNAVRESEAVIQNIHVTPLSLVVVYGFPFALILYLKLFSLSFLRARSSWLRFCKYYLFAALLHSFIAYSLFIDLLVFFVAGVLSVANKQRVA
ncbi:hypothetical protein [Aurantivibrio plasticivorans]